MKFAFDGREYDTDKPICVLGFIIRKSWSGYLKSSDFDRRCIQEYGSKVKKFYVAELRFCKFSGNNYEKNDVTEMEVVSSQRDDTIWISKDNVIGHSPQECLKIYRAMQEVAE